MTLFYAILLAIIEVNAKGYYCTKHIVTRVGDKCSYIWDKNINKDYYLRRIDFLRINPEINCDNLKPKTKVCVEVDFKKTKKRHPFDEYTTKKGDTCKKIAKNTNSDINTLLNLNNQLNCDDIVEGTYIEYHKDGDYTPDFSNSEEVKIDPKKTTKTTKTKTTKRTTKTTKKTTKTTKKTTKTTKKSTTKTTTKTTKKSTTKTTTKTKKAAKSTKKVVKIITVVKTRKSVKSKN
jgi:thiol:disulfide interchange protein